MFCNYKIYCIQDCGMYFPVYMCISLGSIQRISIYGPKIQPLIFWLEAAKLPLQMALPIHFLLNKKREHSFFHNFASNGYQWMFKFLIILPSQLYYFVLIHIFLIISKDSNFSYLYWTFVSSINYIFISLGEKK